MSVLEPDAMSMPGAGGADLPSIPIVMRGYDRQQVRAFVDQLRAYLADERRRREQAEQAISRLQMEMERSRNPAPPSFEHLGAEAGRVLEQAGSSATLLLDEARARGRAVVEEAEGEAAELIAQAEQRVARLNDSADQALKQAAGDRDRILTEAGEEAQRLRARAEEDASRALEQAREESERIQHAAVAERAAMEAETERLRESRDRMVEFLSRIHGDLGSVLAEAVGPPEGELAVEDPAHAEVPEPEDDAYEQAVVADGAVDRR
jgi:cell division septum initiation protein DivIVA